MKVNEFRTMMEGAFELIKEFKINTPNTIHNQHFHGYFQGFICVLGYKHGYLPCVEYKLMDDIKDYGNYKTAARPKWDVVWHKPDTPNKVAVAFEYQRYRTFSEKVDNLKEGLNILLNKPELLVLWVETFSNGAADIIAIINQCKRKSINSSIALVLNKVQQSQITAVPYRHLIEMKWMFFENLTLLEQKLLSL